MEDNGAGITVVRAGVGGRKPGPYNAVTLDPDNSLKFGPAHARDHPSCLESDPHHRPTVPRLRPAPMGDRPFRNRRRATAFDCVVELRKQLCQRPVLGRVEAPRCSQLRDAGHPLRERVCVDHPGSSDGVFRGAAVGPTAPGGFDPTPDSAVPGQPHLLPFARTAGHRQPRPAHYRGRAEFHTNGGLVCDHPAASVFGRGHLYRRVVEDHAAPGGGRRDRRRVRFVGDGRRRPPLERAQLPPAKKGSRLPVRTDPHPRERRGDRHARVGGRGRRPAHVAAAERW